MFSLSNFVNLMTQNLIIWNNNSKSDIAVVCKKSLMARSSISPAGSSSSTDSVSPGNTPPPAGSPPTTPSPSSSTSSSGSAAKETWSPAWTDGRLDPKTGLPTKLLLDPDGYLMSYIKVDGRLAYYRCKLNPRHVFNEASSEVLQDKRLSGTTYLMPTSIVVKNKLLKQGQTAFKLPPTPKDWTFNVSPKYLVTTDGFTFMICNEALYGGARVIGFSSPSELAMLTNRCLGTGRSNL